MFASSQALTLDRVRSIAPSVFAEGKHESRSERYGYVDSFAMIQGLLDKGFEITAASEARAKDESKKGFTKHMVRLRHAASYQALKTGLADAREAGKGGFIRDQQVAMSLGVSAEVVLTNSHDGTSAVTLHGGLLRAACFNGLIVADTLIESIHVTHSKRLVANVIDAAFSVAEQSSKTIEVVQSWSGLLLAPAEQLALAKAAHVARFADDEGNVTTTVQPQRLLEARRSADSGSDLWTTFNRVQENVVKGGLNDYRKSKVDEAGKYHGPRALKTRPVKGIDGNVKLNKALWTLAEEMAKIKTAA